MPAVPGGNLRTMAAATLANTVGSGLWTAGVALYLTRGVGLSATSVGVGLTVAGLVGLGASVPLGQLADRCDPRTLRAVLQLLQAAVAAAYLLVGSFPAFLAVAVADALLVAGNLAVRSALVAAVSGPGGRVHAFAVLRAVANVGISVGAVLGGVVLVLDSPVGYDLLPIGNAITYLVSAGLLMRLPRLPPAVRTVPARTGRRRRFPPRMPALRDGRYLAVSAAGAVLSVHGVVLRLALPLWIVDRTDAPRWAVSAVLVTNTLLTVGLTVRIGRAARTARSAARSMSRAGVILAAAMLIYATTAGRPARPAVALLLIATVVYTVGDLLHATAAAALAYDLAVPRALGQYQGVHVLATGFAEAVAPVLLLLMLADGGAAGWLLLAAVFAVAGRSVPALTRRAMANRGRSSPEPLTGSG